MYHFHTQIVLKITIFQPILKIKQLWLLFNPRKDIRDAFGNKQEHGIIPVQLGLDVFFFNCQLVHKSVSSMWDKAWTYSSDCGDSHDQLSCAIAGLAAGLRLPQLAEEVEDVVGTVLVWHCAATGRVHVCSQSSHGRHHGWRGWPGGRGGDHHERGVGSGHSEPSLEALTGLGHSPV